MEDSVEVEQLMLCPEAPPWLSSQPGKEWTSDYVLRTRELESKGGMCMGQKGAFKSILIVNIGWDKWTHKTGNKASIIFRLSL